MRNRQLDHFFDNLSDSYDGNRGGDDGELHQKRVAGAVENSAMMRPQLNSRSESRMQKISQHSDDQLWRRSDVNEAEGKRINDG